MSQTERWILALSSIAFILACLYAGIAWGGVKTYTYSRHWNQNPATWTEEIAKFDLLVSADRPEAFAAYRRFNPDLKILWEHQPQWTYPDDGNNPWWIADTLWSITRAWQWACWQNERAGCNWILKDTRGRPIESPPGVLVNWTPYAKSGKHGDSAGLRPYQYYPRLLARIAGGNEVLNPWDWNVVGNNCQGISLEVFADCLATVVGPERLRFADPDCDGVAEGASHSCSLGGDREILTNLTRAANTMFWRDVQRYVSTDIVIITNDNRRSIHGPQYLDEFNGRKLEQWMILPGWSWVDWFFGRDGVGYYYAERFNHRSGADGMDGWDVSLLRSIWQGGTARDTLAVCTALLGDGYVCLDDPALPQLRPNRPALLDVGIGKPTTDMMPRWIGRLVLTRGYENAIVYVDPIAERGWVEWKD